MYFKSVDALLDEPGDSFPRRSELKIIRGKTLTKTPSWHKAIVLVELAKGRQLRLVGWQRNKEGDWRMRQKFNIAKSYAFIIAEVCEAYGQAWES
ncbi:MAG: hypothetical protein ACFFD8_04320 [Candidatus Thorarchaeota archaeon]